LGGRVEAPRQCLPGVARQRVPRIIHKVIIVDDMKLPQLLPAMEQAVGSFRDMNPHYELRLYSGGDCTKYIKRHYDEDVLNAFRVLRPYSYKCDLFRYLVLLQEGGFYSDMRQVCLRPLDEAFSSDFEWFSALDRLYMHTAFLASVPGHPWLQRAVDAVLRNVALRRYGDSPLDPTGPGVLGSACVLAEKRPRWLLGELRDGFVTSHRGERVVLGKYRRPCGRAYAAAEWGAEDGGGNSYNRLWHAREVYCCRPADRL